MWGLIIYIKAAFNRQGEKKRGAGTGMKMAKIRSILKLEVFLKNWQDQRETTQVFTIRSCYKILSLLQSNFYVW